MSDPLLFSAHSLGLYDVGDELYMSIGTIDGRHIKIELGFAQALMINEDTAKYIRKHFQQQEADAAEMFQFTA